MLAPVQVEASLHQLEAFAELVEVDGHFLHFLTVGKLVLKTGFYEPEHLVVDLGFECEVVQLVAKIGIFLLLVFYGIERLGVEWDLGRLYILS